MNNLASFKNMATSWTPRRYTANMDMSAMDNIVGRTGEGFGTILTGGFVGVTSATDVDGIGVAWAIRCKPGEQFGTLIIYPGSETAASRGLMRNFTTADPAPWSSLGAGTAASMLTTTA